MEARETRSNGGLHGAAIAGGVRGSCFSEWRRRRPLTGARPFLTDEVREGTRPRLPRGSERVEAEAEAARRGERAREGACAVVFAGFRKGPGEGKEHFRAVPKGAEGRSHLLLRYAVGTDGPCGIPPLRRRRGPATLVKPSLRGDGGGAWERRRTWTGREGFVRACISRRREALAARRGEATARCEWGGGEARG